MGNDDSKVPQSLIGALDVLGAGEVAKQLVGPIVRGVGKFWAPRQMRRENEARIDSFNAWDEALKHKGYQPGAVELTLGERTELRLLAENINRQVNREAIAAFAIEQARLDADTPADPQMDPPDHAWVDRFWQLAEASTDAEILCIGTVVEGLRAEGRRNPGRERPFAGSLSSARFEYPNLNS